MVSPARKRDAVAHLGAVLNVSERRACQVISQPRSTQRYRPLQPDKDTALAADLKRLSAAHPRAGYRRAAALLRRCGMEVNLKRVHRIWRREGLKVPRRQRKRQRLGTSENGTQRLSAQRPGHVWSYDFVFDQTEDGRRLKWLPICDEYSRELVALEVERRMEAKDVIRILEAAIGANGGPRSSSAATMVLSSSRRPCRTGSGGGDLKPSISNPAVHGKTPTAKASTAVSGTSS